MDWKMISLQILFIVALVSFGDAMEDMPPEDCRFKTLAHTEKNIFFVIEVKENPKKLKSTLFGISGKYFTLSLMKGLKTYVRYAVPSVNAEFVDCMIVNDGVTIRYEIKEEDSLKEIKLDRGESVGMVYGGVRLKVVHDKESRKSIPFSVEVIEGPNTTANIFLGEKINSKVVNVGIWNDDKNYVMVGKKEIEVVGDSLNLDLEMNETSNVIVSNLPEDRPTIAQGETSYLTCLSEDRCPLDIPKKVEALMLRVKVIDNKEVIRPAIYKNAKDFEIVYMWKNKDNVIYLRKEDFGNNLYFKLQSKTNDLSKCATISLFNSHEKDYLRIEDQFTHFHGSEIDGVFITGHKATTFYFTIFKDDLVFWYEKLKPQTLEPVWVKGNLKKNEKNFIYLSKEEINENGEVRFSLQPNGNDLGIYFKPTNPCKDNPCKHGGTCTKDEDVYKCECKDGFEGVNCENTNPCWKDPCKNGGTCKEDGDVYKCECKDGFRGANCDNIDPCWNDPCKNGGICNEDGDVYKCECKDGFRGSNCENIDHCWKDPCKNGGLCKDDGDVYKCECKDGFRGFNCENLNPCWNDPCINGGICNENGDMYKCECKDGFRGGNCENTTLCLNNPCKNGGTCNENGDVYKCECKEGFRGVNCENTNSPKVTFDCDTNNPCFKLETPDKFYYPHADTNKFLQCDAFGSCFKMSCSPGFVWNDAFSSCVGP